MPKLDTEGEILAIVRSLPRFFEWLEAEGKAVKQLSARGSKGSALLINTHVIDLEPLRENGVVNAALTTPSAADREV